jgi:hypothetical protein
MSDENHEKTSLLANGEPYFCGECKRTHTKGKIYKEHLKYAKFDESNKENTEGNNDDLIKQLDTKDRYFEDLIKTIKGTELIKFLPDLLQKLKYSWNYGNENDNEFTYDCFKDLLELTKKSNLLSDFFSEFSSMVYSFMLDERNEKFPNIRPFYDFLDAIKGTELLSSKFLDLLNLADNLPPGYECTNNYEAFFELINEIKGAEVMTGNVSFFFKGLNNIYDAFSALIDVIKGTKLIKKKIIDVLDLFDIFLDEEYDEGSKSSEKYYAFTKLIDILKGTELINVYYSLIEERFITILIGLRTVYEFSIIINAIKGTELLKKNFCNILEKTKRFPNDSYQLKAISNLIELIESDLVNRNLFNILETIEMLSVEDKKEVISDLIYKIDLKDFKEKLPLLRERFPLFTSITEKTYRGWGISL